MQAAGKGRSGQYSNRKKQPNRDSLSEVGVGGGGGAEVLTFRGGGGSQAGSTGSLSYVLAAGKGRSGRYRMEQGQLD